MCVGVGLVERNKVILHSLASGVRHGRIKAKSFPKDTIEVRECHQLIHRWCFSFYRSKLLSEFVLNVHVHRKGEQTPSDRTGSGFMSCDEESDGENSEPRKGISPAIWTHVGISTQPYQVQLN